MPIDNVQMPDIAPPTAIVINCAAAADGGSLLLRLSVNGKNTDSLLDRSMASRGTPRYERIMRVSGPPKSIEPETPAIPKQERDELLAMLASRRMGHAPPWSIILCRR